MIHQLTSPRGALSTRLRQLQQEQRRLRPARSAGTLTRYTTHGVVRVAARRSADEDTSTETVPVWG